MCQLAAGDGVDSASGTTTSVIDPQGPGRHGAACAGARGTVTAAARGGAQLRRRTPRDGRLYFPVYRYETELRAMIDAKSKGEGVDLSADVTPEPSNAVDLMAALKESLGQAAGVQTRRLRLQSRGSVWRRRSEA